MPMGRPDGRRPGRPDGRAPGGVIVLVTHGDIAAGLIGHALGTPVERRLAAHEPPEGSVAELTVDGAEWRLVRPARAPAR